MTSKQNKIHTLECEINHLEYLLVIARGILKRWVLDANTLNDNGLFDDTNNFLEDVK
jgi:hypothetical protein